MAAASSIRDLVTLLCQSILKGHREAKRKERLSNPLKLPSHLHLEGCHDDQAAAVSRLFKMAYDILLLRWKREWSDRGSSQWLSSLSPDSRCLSYMFSLFNETDRNKLTHSVDTLMEFEDSGVILDFLANLAKPSQELVPTSISDSRYSNEVFKQLPFSSSLSYYSNEKVFETKPCSVFYSNETTDSTLFSGLTHTTTSSLNTTLKVPPLPDTPTDLLQRYLQGHPRYELTPPPTPPLEDLQEESMLELFDSVTSLDEPLPPVSWEGPVESTCSLYLSESGLESFQESTGQFLSLLASVAGTETPPTSLRTLNEMERFKNQLEQAFVWADQRKLELELFGDEIALSFHGAIDDVLHYCQVKFDQLQVQDSSQFWLQASTSELQLLLDAVVSVLKTSTDNNGKGLELVNLLYHHCAKYQGLPVYPLLVGLFRQTVKPYLWFLHKWVFQGNCHVGFGLTANQASLQCRDQRYWFDGFHFKDGCVPEFVARYKDVILTTGKSLNLLRLCCPQHHLCHTVHSSQVPLFVLSQSLKEIKELHLVCQRYQEHVEGLTEELRQAREIELLEEELAALEPVLKARQQARKSMEELRREDERLHKEEIERKRSLLNELRETAERARALREEKMAEERERDKIESVPDSETQRLETVARQEITEYYQKLSHEAEMRGIRAQWRTKRFALGKQRLQLLRDIEEREERELEALLEESNDKVQQSESLQSSFESEATPNQLPETTDAREFTAAAYEQSTTRGHAPESVVQDILYPIDEAPPTLVETTRGHAPESVVQDILYPIEEAPPTPTETTRGHAPDSVVQDVLYPIGEAPPTSTETTQGHVPDSVVQDVLYPIEEAPPTLIKTTRGHSPESVMQDILYPIEEAPPTHVETTRGHTPDSVIQDVLYPIQGHAPDSEDAPPTATKATRGYTPPTSIDKLIYYGRKEDKRKEKEGKEEEYIIVYPSVAPYASYTTMYPLNETPFTSSNVLLTSLPDISKIDDTHFLLSLPSLVGECVSFPLLTQANLVNAALVQYFVSDLSLKDHFCLLKRYVLLEDSGFSDALCSSLFQQLTYGQSLDQLCRLSLISPLLQSSLDQSLSKGNEKLTRNLSLTLAYKPSLLSTTSLKALDFLRMDYKVSWPLNIIITKHHLDKYNEVFHFMLRIKRASWLLRKVYVGLSQDGLTDSFSHQQLRQIHAQRQELQHFIAVMEGYIANQVFHLSWLELESSMFDATCLDSLMGCHNRYLDGILSRCLLNKKAAPVLALVDSSLGTIIKFCSQLLSRSGSLNLLHIRHSFTESCKLLFKVIEKLVQRGYQPHLEEFLLRLNFNDYYKP